MTFKSILLTFMEYFSFQLANVLEVDTELVKQAVSLYCRLQFARKLNAETEQDRIKRHPSWLNIPTSNIK